MKGIYAILIVFLGILVIPIFSIVALSFDGSKDIFGWYSSIWNKEDFRNAFFLSVFISLATSLLTTVVSFVISLSWFNSKQRIIVLVAISIVALLPGDIFALSLNKISQLFGIYVSNISFLIVALIFYTMPFAVLLLWARYYFISTAIISSARDIGLKPFYTVTRILLPLSKGALITCALFSFLLAINEYPRTYYLSGSTVLLSKFLNGKLNSGADGSIYAGGSITILLTGVIVVLYFIFQRISQRNYKQ